MLTPAIISLIQLDDAITLTDMLFDIQIGGMCDRAWVLVQGYFSPLYADSRS